VKFRKQPDWVVVGAGFSGAVFARRIAENSKSSVLVIDRRAHIGGNAYDPIGENGIRIHKYGPHIFHTNSDKIFNFLSEFTNWREYEHKVLGEFYGQFLPIPFNLTTLRSLDRKLFNESVPTLLGFYGFGTEIPVQKLRDSKNSIFKKVGEIAFESVFRGYSQKQWGMDLNELSPSVGARVPIRLNYDDRYFTDKFQFMPVDSYESMFWNILDHPQIQLELNLEFNVTEHKGEIGTIYTGALDELLSYELGSLPYRSLNFEFENLDVEQFQPVGQVNYPVSEKFTRITEFKHLTNQVSSHTTIAREFPVEYIPGVNTPYYPIPKEVNSKLHSEYKHLLKSRYSHIVPLGRLADYKYYNMDQAAARAIQVADSIFDSI
jgi:UDP-galactopyranose mutase